MTERRRGAKPPDVMTARGEAIAQVEHAFEALVTSASRLHERDKAVVGRRLEDQLVLQVANTVRDLRRVWQDEKARGAA